LLTFTKRISKRKKYVLSLLHAFSFIHDAQVNLHILRPSPKHTLPPLKFFKKHIDFCHALLLRIWTIRFCAQSASHQQQRMRSRVVFRRNAEQVEENRFSVYAMNRPCHAREATLYKFLCRFIIVGHQSRRKECYARTKDPGELHKKCRGGERKETKKNVKGNYEKWIWKIVSKKRIGYMIEQHIASEFFRQMDKFCMR